MKANLKKDSIRLVVVLAAALLMSVNIQSFINAGGLFPGGAQGLTIVVQRIVLKYFGIINT